VAALVLTLQQKCVMEGNLCFYIGVCVQLFIISALLFLNYQVICEYRPRGHTQPKLHVFFLFFTVVSTLYFSLHLQLQFGFIIIYNIRVKRLSESRIAFLWSLELATTPFEKYDLIIAYGAPKY